MHIYSYIRKSPLSQKWQSRWVYSLSVAAGLTFQTATAEPEYLHEIVVQEKQPIVSKVSNTHSIDREQMEDRGDISLEESLEMVPNLNIRAGGQGVPRIDIRGLRTRHIKFLVNGVPFNSTYDGQFDPSFIPTSQIDRVKVTTGGTSELYGAGAFGVIDVLTRSFHENHLQLNTETGNWGHRYASLQAGGNHNDVDFYGNLTHRNRDTFELSNDFDATDFENGDNRLNSDRERNSGFGSLNYQVNDDLILGMTGSFLLGEYGIPPSTLSDDFAQRPRFERIKNQKNYTLQGSFQYDPASAYFARGWVYTNYLKQDENRYDDATFDSIDDDSISGSFLTETKTQRNGLGLQNGFQISPQSRITFALDARHEQWEQNGVIRNVASGGGGGSTTFDLRDIDEDEELAAYSIAGEYEIQLTEPLGLVVGAGHHWQDPKGISNDDAGSYLIGLNYAVNPQLSLHGSVVRKVRMPSIRNLFDADRGNPNLHPEVLKGFETGVEIGLKQMDVLIGLTAFYYDIDDFIRRDRDTDLFENVEKSRVRGVEISMGFSPIEKLDTQLSVSLQDSEDRSGNGIDELTNTPGVLLNLDWDYRFNDQWALHGKFLHVDKQYFYTRNEPFIQDELQSVDRLDLRLRWKPAGSGLTADVGVDNVFDEDYEDEYALPAPGRMFTLGLGWKH